MRSDYCDRVIYDKMSVEHIYLFVEWRRNLAISLCRLYCYVSLILHRVMYLLYLFIGKLNFVSLEAKS